MSIQDWAAIGEVVGAIAVIVTLIYAATQIRQNTRQIRSEGHVRVTESYNDILSQLLADDVLFKTLVRGCQDWENLTAFEQSKCHIFFHQHLMHLRMAYQLHAKSAMDDDVYRSVEDAHIIFLANPGAKIWWEMVGESLVESELRGLVNRKLKKLEGQKKATTEAWEFFDPKNWVEKEVK